MQVRGLLRRVLKVAEHSLEFTGEEFSGYITFLAPAGDTYPENDFLNVCTEIAQEDLGVKATVSTWALRREGELLRFQPWDFELQEEDRAVPPRRNHAFNEHAADVRPVNGWRS